MTEAFRIIKQDNSCEIEEAWTGLIVAVKTTSVAISSLSGTRINLEHEMFTRVIGWDRLKVRPFVESLLRLTNAVRSARAP